VGKRIRIGVDRDIVYSLSGRLDRPKPDGFAGDLAAWPKKTGTA
jgi:hypothetical protein